MDPISAIGVAAAVIQFVQFGLQVAKRLDEFNKAHPGEVPRSLQAISIQLPLLLNALSRIKTDDQVGNLDVDTKCILRGVISGCQAQVAEVETMMNEISRTPGEAFKAKIKKVFTSLKYDEKIWAVERNLHTYISVLILHHVVDPNELPPMPAEDTFFDIREQLATPFVERPKLTNELEDWFHDAARSQVKSPTIITLVGPKGVGKTQLALSYCYTAKSLGQFRTAFLIDASTLESLCLGFESMYATIKRSTSGARKDKVNFVREYLNDLWHPWLLILDNYEPTALYNDIIEMLPTRGYGGIILITRCEEASGLGSVVRVPKFLTIQDQAQLNSLLTQEVQNKNINGIKNLVEQGADVDTLIWDQWPCLHRCALFGLFDAVEFLLDEGANPNPPLELRKPLYWAASGGHQSICQLLLDFEDKNGQVSKPVDVQAAFDAASEEGHLDTMRLLVNRRQVAVNNENRYSQTPLQNAAKKGYTDVLKFLLNHGALKEGRLQGEGALVEAASSGHLEIVKILCLEENVNPNCKDSQGLTALCHAAGLRDESFGKGVELTNFLLSCGANPNLVGTDGPLHRAAVHDNIAVIRLLLKHGADPAKDCNGWDPLTNAIKYHSLEAVAVLLAAEVGDAEARIAWLNSSLRYSCRAGDRETILQILNAGADINAVESTGHPKGATPLLLAILGGHVKAAQLLIRRRAKQDLGDEKGRFPLPTAAEMGYDGLVRDMLRAGGDPNMQCGPNKDTALILAAGKKHDKVVKVLLDGGADRMLANKFGDIALDLAEEKGHQETISLLDV
ncbi:Ankyrin-1 [Lachnellula suecica]|uniref:Ankyrin-1 n=1 Tax=Lachnellula suecica TaxID=602035 RepID=A0A8T9CC22_9HELO|nr:Ankyrin-1 [Lachnellula suecica]